MAERPQAVPEGKPEYVYVVCTADPTHTDEKSHVLRAVWERQGADCGCGAKLERRAEPA